MLIDDSDLEEPTNEISPINPNDDSTSTSTENSSDRKIESDENTDGK